MQLILGKQLEFEFIMSIVDCTTSSPISFSLRLIEFGDIDIGVF